MSTTLTIPTDFTETTSVTSGEVTLTVGTFRADGLNARRSWHYYISVRGKVVYTSDDLSGWGDAPMMLETFVDFLSAWVESTEWQQRNRRSDGENADLFPEWLYPLISHEVETLYLLTRDEEEG